MYNVDKKKRFNRDQRDDRWNDNERRSDRWNDTEKRDRSDRWITERGNDQNEPIESIEITPINYIPHEAISSLTEEAVEEYRRKHKICISRNGRELRPVTEFKYAGFSDSIMRLIQNDGFENPTPIQSQGWPIALSGKNMVGIAQTGSGKTLSFILPALSHISVQKPLTKRDGPIVLILTPTRELANQIDSVARKYSECMRYRSTCIYGGAPKGKQINELRYSPQIVIATPGRLIDLFKEGSIRLNRVSFLVLDEADRMLDMGFQPQLEEICKYIPKNRQVLLWSATWPKEVEEIAEEYTGNNYIKITIGDGTELTTNIRIKQHVYVCEEIEKTDLLEKIYNECLKEEANPKMIIFTNKKRTCDEIARTLYRNRIGAESLHGDKSQNERDYVINSFRQGKYNVLVATDVAARGLDIKDVKYVVNYDFPNSVEDYVHRIGRTARGNEAKGTAYTLFTRENGGNAKKFIRILKTTNQEVPRELESMTNSSGFRSNKYDRYRRRY